MRRVWRRGRPGGRGSIERPRPLEQTLARPQVKEVVTSGNKRRFIMFRQMITRVGMPAVVVAMFLLAGPAWAQHHGGGGHGGGFHSGGFHSGGFHSGGFHSGGFHSNNF